MAQPDVTTDTLVAAWLGTGFTASDERLKSAHKAAEAFIRARCTWAPDPAEGDDWPPAPDDLVQAVGFLTARFLARRNSPDGLVGMGDLGVGRVTVSDRDVDRLIAPWRRVVLA